MKIAFVTPKSMCLEPTVNSVWSMPDVERRLFPNEQMDEKQLDALKKYAPNLIVYIGAVSGNGRVDTAILKELLPKPIHLCCDPASPDWWPLLQEYKDQSVFSLTVGMDGGSTWPQQENDLVLWHPLANHYYLVPCAKTIRFGFMGGTGSQDRSQAISTLKGNCDLQVGKRDEAWGTYQQYADFMLSTEIALNFARTGCGQKKQMKNRVHEAAMAKCCLLEQVGAPTSKYYRPGIDYIEWSSAGEAEEILNKLDRDKNESVYAFNLHDMWKRHYTPRHFWKQVFTHLDLM
jgi:hypothetical protein